MKGADWMDRIQTEWWWMFKWRIPEMSGILFPGSRWREQRASSGHEQLPRSAWMDRGGHQCPLMMMDSMHEEVIAQHLDGTVQLVLWLHILRWTCGILVALEWRFGYIQSAPHDCCVSCHGCCH